MKIKLTKETKVKSANANKNNLPALASEVQPYTGMILTKEGMVLELKRRQYKFLFSWICSQVAMSTKHINLFEVTEARVISSELTRVFNKAVTLARDKNSRVTKKELQVLIINSTKDISNCLIQELSLLDVDL